MYCFAPSRVKPVISDFCTSGWYIQASLFLLALTCDNVASTPKPNTFSGGSAGMGHSHSLLCFLEVTCLILCSSEAMDMILRFSEAMNCWLESFGFSTFDFAAVLLILG